MTVMHLVASIEWLEQKINGIKSDNVRKLYCFEAWGMSEEDLRAAIESMKKKGMKFIPSDSCKHKRPDGSCGCGDYAKNKKLKIWKKSI